MKIKLNYFVAILMLFAVASSHAQTKIDSLKTLLFQAKEDTNKVKLLISLSEQYDFYNSPERTNLLIEAFALTQKINSLKYEQRMLLSLSSIFYYRNMFDISMYYTLKYLNLTEQEKDKNIKYLIYINYGNLLEKEGKFQESSKYYHLIKGYYLSIGDSAKYAISLNCLSFLLQTTNHIDSAYIYQIRALEIFKSKKTYGSYANSVLGMAELHLKKNELALAKSNAFKALNIYTSKTQLKYGIGNCWDDIGSIYNATNQADSAIISYQIALKYFNELNFHLQKSLCFKGLAKAYLIKKNYEQAYKYQVLFKDYSDSASFNKLKVKLLEMEIKHDITKREGELNTKKIELAAQNKQKNYLLGIVGVVIILLIISYYAYNQKKKDNKFITEQKKLVDHKQKEILDSINYAKRIQFTLLANQKLLDICKLARNFF